MKLRDIRPLKRVEKLPVKLGDIRLLKLGARIARGTEQARLVKTVKVLILIAKWGKEQTASCLLGSNTH